MIDHDLIERLRSGDCCNENNEDAASHILALGDALETASTESSRWKNAARVMSALYGGNAKWDGGSWFRDNIEISLDEDLPPEDIEELLQIAWKANKDGVTEALATASGRQK